MCEDAKNMARIILRAILIVVSGAAVLLLAGVWGQNQLTAVPNSQLLLAGVTGTLLILLSLSYSLRKRFWKWGGIKKWLRFHELAAVSGTAIILWHTGLRVHNFTGWAAVLLLLALCTSGIVGRYLHMEINRELGRRKRLGEDSSSLSQLQWWRNEFQVWRRLHLPMTRLFLLILLVHILATTFYGGW